MLPRKGQLLGTIYHLKENYMLYAYDIKETSEGFIGECFDLDFVTKPQKTFDDAEETLTDGFAGFIELVYRKKGKPIPLPATDCKK